MIGWGNFFRGIIPSREGVISGLVSAYDICTIYTDRYYSNQQYTSFLDNKYFSKKKTDQDVIYKAFSVLLETTTYIIVDYQALYAYTYDNSKLLDKKEKKEDIVDLDNPFYSKYQQIKSFLSLVLVREAPNRYFSIFTYIFSAYKA